MSYSPTWGATQSCGLFVSRVLLLEAFSGHLSWGSQAGWWPCTQVLGGARLELKLMFGTILLACFWVSFLLQAYLWGAVRLSALKVVTCSSLK